MNCLIINTLRHHTSKHSNKLQAKPENRAHCQMDNDGFEGDSSCSCVETGLSGEEIRLNVKDLEKGLSSHAIVKKQRAPKNTKQG